MTTAAVPSSSRRHSFEQVPLEILSIIDDMAQNPVFLPSIAQLHVQSDPPYKEQAVAIADLARKKIVQLIITRKDRFLDFSENDVKKFEARLALASKGLANVWQELQNAKAKELFLEINQDLLNGCRDYLAKREGDLERIMHNPDAYVSSLIGIAVIYYELREFENAENFFSKAVEATKSHSDNKVFKCEALIKIALTASDMQSEKKTEEFLQEASEIACTLLEEKDRCAALLKIAKAYSEIENIAKAEKFLELAEANSCLVLPLVHRYNALIDIALEHFKIGNKKKAEDLLSNTEKVVNDNLDGKLKAVLLAFVAEAYVKLKNLKEAERIVDIIPRDLDQRNLPLVEIFNTHIEAGNLQEAERINNKISSMKFKRLIQSHLDDLRKKQI